MLSVAAYLRIQYLCSFVPSADKVHKECTSFDYDDETLTVHVVVGHEPFGQPTQPSFITVGAEAFLDCAVCLFQWGKLYRRCNFGQEDQCS